MSAEKPRDFVATLDRILAVIPADQAALRRDLEGVKGDVFLVLPETAHEYWRRAGAVLNDYITEQIEKQHEWARRVCAIWFDKQDTANAPTERRCGNCAHWGKEPYEYFDHSDEVYADVKEPTFQKCGGIVRLGRVPSQEDEDRRLMPATKATTLAFTTDASGYEADLWTREAFHCALWGPRA